MDFIWLSPLKPTFQGAKYETSRMACFPEWYQLIQVKLTGKVPSGTEESSPTFTELRSYKGKDCWSVQEGIPYGLSSTVLWQLDRGHLRGTLQNKVPQRDMGIGWRSVDRVQKLRIDDYSFTKVRRNSGVYWGHVTCILMCRFACGTVSRGKLALGKMLCQGKSWKKTSVYRGKE